MLIFSQFITQYCSIAHSKFATTANDNNTTIIQTNKNISGHYAPSIAHRVWQGNQAVQQGSASSADKIELPLGGLGIGNGLTNPEAQYPWYPEMVYNNSHNIKVVDESTYETMKAVVPKCTKLIHQCNQGDSTLDSFACQTAFVVCNMGLTSPYQMTGLNPYDIRKKCDKPPLCYDFSPVQAWLNKPETMAALGVDTDHVHRWESCNFGINSKFHTDWMKDFSPFVLDLLDKAGIPVLIYAGDVDFICNYLGNQAWSKELPWKGQEGFNKATPADWKGQGLARVNADDKKFTFLQVYVFMWLLVCVCYGIMCVDVYLCVCVPRDGWNHLTISPSICSFG